MNRVANAAKGVLLLFITSLLCSVSAVFVVVPIGVGGVNSCFDAGHQYRRRHPPQHHHQQSKLAILLMTPPSTKTTDGGQLPPTSSKRQRLLEYIRRFRSLLDDEVWSKHNVSPMQVVRDTRDNEIIMSKKQQQRASHQDEEDELMLALSDVDQYPPSPHEFENRGTLLDNVVPKGDDEQRHVAQKAVEVANSADGNNNTLLVAAPPTNNDVAAIAATTTTTTLSSRRTQSASHVNLSGTWKPIVTERFKKEYDTYLSNCCQPYLYRKLLVNGIVFQKEHICQLNDGRELMIIATNPVGDWNRTLLTSSLDAPTNVTIRDPDGDTVYIEAYWINNGTKHKSILRGKPNVMGGYFETVRYLEQKQQRGGSSNSNDNNDKEREDVLICESKFYPPSTSLHGKSKEFNYGQVVWRFERDQ